MEEIRIQAKTLDEAITNACVELGVSSDRMKYTVVQQGTNGFLGFGAKPYIINASAVPEEPEVPKKKETKPVEPVKAAKPVEKPAEKPAEKAPEKKEEAAPAAQKAASVKEERGKADSETDEKAVKSERSEKSDRIPRRERGGRDSQRDGRNQRQDRGERRNSEKRPDRRDRKPYRSEETAECSETASESRREPREIKPIVLTEDPVKRAEDFLVSLFAKMEMQINYSGEYNNAENELTINLSGADMGVLIGKRGQTLDALQYLTSQVVNKHQNGYIRVKMDTENYRERRKETLESFAENMADKVKKNKRPVVLEPMNAYERRIIHSILQDDKEVLTRSEGEEPYRHVVICPVKKRK